VLPDSERLTKIFCELAAVPSPSGCERQVADYVKAHLGEMGIQVQEDGTGQEIGGDTGNLYALIPGARGERDPVIALGAHLDTVAVNGKIDPVLRDGIFHNQEPTILGADNKATVAAIIHVVEQLAASPDRPAFEVFFSVAEELGVLGIKYMDPQRISSPMAAVFDSAGPVGGIIVRAPTQNAVGALFRGKAAHAGVEPESGRSAIRAAALAISDMDLGRIDEETTANIGIIKGGSAVNIVPDLCRILGEARSLDHNRLSVVVQDMVAAMQFAGTSVGVDVEIDVTEEYKAFNLDESSPAVALAARAVREAGFVPSFLASGGGSDANALNDRGIPTVNLDCGMRAVHTPDEHIALADLEGMTRVMASMLLEAQR